MFPAYNMKVCEKRPNNILYPTELRFDVFKPLQNLQMLCYNNCTESSTEVTFTA